MRMLFWFGRSNCGEVNGEFYCDEKKWVSQAGWEEHLRNFISGASPDESNESIFKKVLWIHAPDYSRQGVIGDIRNVTNRETDYHNLWKSLAIAQENYGKFAIEPIEKKLAVHKDLFETSYETLDAA